MRVFPEVNRVVKDWRKVKVKVALCYPNIYRAGMTGLTVQLLYYLFNRREEVVCERFFKPIEGGKPLSVESRRGLESFNIAAFTFQYELDYVNFISMLLDSGIPPRRMDRGEEHPIIIAGGPAIWANPCVLEDYVDLFVIGDAEPILDDLLDLYINHPSRRAFLDYAADLRGVYLPGRERGVERVLARSLDDEPYPLRQVIPKGGRETEPIFGRAFTLEATRSCNRGCRFCMITWISRPARHRSLSILKRLIDEGVRLCGVDKVAVIGAGFSDHPDITGLCSYVVESGLKLSIPSVRGDLLSEEVFKALAKGGQRTLTIAPEAGTETLREALGKPMSDEDIVEAARRALNAGINRLKLYFMVGIPGEEREDVEGMVRLTSNLAKLGFASVHVSVNVLIPKAHTPFQWLPLAERRWLREALRTAKSASKLPKVKVDVASLRVAELQAALSRGDVTVGRMISEVAKKGGKLGLWRSVAKDLGIDLEGLVYRPYNPDEELPWSFIDVGVSGRVLAKELDKALNAA
ncbi:MAG: hypothetical protein DRJ98_01790 [Thermoprotei archaeon]|nr:MAG: hypothetical protein DRJ98_01790 [Thermoprotei archaeon]RLF18120.1 MAG: hypothetical protein DRN06_02305 [Thermoprotei archaeon]